jgi:LysM repeat protein
MLDPFSGPGTFKAERQQQRREQFKVAVWAIIWANVVLFGGLLIQGCQRDPAAAETSGGGTAEVASSDTNGVAAAPANPDTNSPVATAPEAAPTNSLPEAAPMVAPTPVQASAKPYTVAKGDSFYKIAKANGVSMKALMAANPGVDSAKIKVGQVLQIPAGAEPATAVSATSPAPASATASQSAAPASKAHARYVVKSGDSLARIARAHKTTVQALKAANGLTSERIIAGQSLRLPETKTAAAAGAQG